MWDQLPSSRPPPGISDSLYFLPQQSRQYTPPSRSVPHGRASFDVLTHVAMTLPCALGNRTSHSSRRDATRRCASLDVRDAVRSHITSKHLLTTSRRQKALMYQGTHTLGRLSRSVNSFTFDRVTGTSLGRTGANDECPIHRCTASEHWQPGVCSSPTSVPWNGGKLALKPTMGHRRKNVSKSFTRRKSVNHSGSSHFIQAESHLVSPPLIRWERPLQGARETVEVDG